MIMTMRTDAVWEASAGSATHLRAGRHEFLADEPKSVGGGDGGPTPIQYLFGAIASCLIAMGKVVAREMELSISSIKARVEGDINPDGMMAKDPSVRPGCLEIRVTVEVGTAEAQEKIDKWLEVTESRCAVRDCVANITPIVVERR